MASPDWRAYGTSATVAVACALGFGVTLSAIGAPREIGPRAAAITKNIDKAEGIARYSSRRPDLPLDAICTTVTATEARTLKSSLSDVLNRAHLNIGSLEVAPSAAGANAGVARVNIIFGATGDYAAALQAINELSRVKPVIFVETLDLSAVTSAVSLHLTGAVYCAA